MNKHNAKQYLPLVQALADGKTIQCKQIPSGNWFDFEEAELNAPPEYYRIKPEPKLRAWRPEEVPLGARIKESDAIFFLILACSSRGVRVADIERFHTFPYDHLISCGYRYSTDNGLTWHPCGVTE